jgi:inhibitor of cysteine peptidase
MHRAKTFPITVGLTLLAAVTVIVLSGCSTGGGATGSTVTVTEKDADTTATVAAGQDLKVALSGNPSTGYSWSVAARPLFLEQQGEPTFDSKAPSNVVGASGTQTTTFKATSAGSGILKMIYSRPFEKDTPPAKTFSITVIAK